jgi:hypothetical protein
LVGTFEFEIAKIDLSVVEQRSRENGDFRIYLVAVFNDACDLDLNAVRIPPREPKAGASVERFDDRLRFAAMLVPFENRIALPNLSS